MARTSSALVVDNLKTDYTSGATLTRPINIATLVVDRIVACATQKGITHSEDLLVEIETQLASHYYTRTDRIYRSKATDRASGVYLYNNKNPEPYLANALELDYSGCLNAIINSKRASLYWTGKDDGEKLDYDERNLTGS